MALNAYLNLYVNGEEVIGLPSAIEMGGMDVSGAIEAHSFYHEISVAGSDGSSRSTSRVAHGAITFVKSPDNASIQLHNALNQNMVVSGIITFFKPGNTGQEIVDHVWTIGGGRVVGIRTELLNVLFADTSQVPVQERVSIGYNSLQIADTIASSEVTYSSVLQS